MENAEVAGNPSSGEAQARAAGASSPSPPALEGNRATHGATMPGAVPATAAAAGEGAAAGVGASSAAGGGGEEEKKALETAWNLYLQVGFGDE